MSEFGYIESFIFGYIDCEDENRVKKYYLVVHKIFIITICIYWAYYAYFYMGSEFTSVTLYCLAFLLEISLCILFHLIMWRRFSQINSLIKQMIVRLNEEKRKLLARVQLAFSLIFALISLISFSIYTYFRLFGEDVTLIFEIKDKTCLFIVGTILDFSYQLFIQGIIIHSIFTYIHINIAASLMLSECNSKCLYLKI